VDRFSDSLIGPAPAKIAGQGGVDIGVAWVRRFGEEGGGGHDLAGLAISALRRVQIDPGLLQGVELTVRTGEAFDRRDFFAVQIADRRLAGPHGASSLDQNGASAALSDAAAIFGSHETEPIPQHPKQGGVRRGVINFVKAAIDFQRRHVVLPDRSVMRRADPNKLTRRRTVLSYKLCKI
jgi:hypothetical protein